MNPASIMAIGERHGVAFIENLPKEEQLRICERHLAGPCPPGVRSLFRGIYLDLTNKEQANVPDRN